MKFFKKIFSVFIAMIVFIAANGIFFENYICSVCAEEHEEISFFEFGEKHHDHFHSHACDCCEAENHCCHEENMIEHQKNANVKFFSISLLYFETSKIFVKYFQPKFVFHFNFIIHTVNYQCNHCIGEILKILPIPINNIFNTNVLCSVLRL